MVLCQLVADIAVKVGEGSLGVAIKSELATSWGSVAHVPLILNKCCSLECSKLLQ
jgi:hypothetical protein